MDEDTPPMTAPASPAADSGSFGAQIMRAVAWRSGSQMIAQLIMWAGTFFVIRILDPRDYGLFAMTQSVLVFLSLLNGQEFAGSLVQAPTVTKRHIAQVFGLLIVIISCHQGLKANQGAVGVGRGTTRAMVYSSLAILVVNFFLTLLLNIIFPAGPSAK